MQLICVPIYVHVLVCYFCACTSHVFASQSDHVHVHVYLFLTCTLYNQETFAELQIPFQVVNAAQRIPVVEYSLNKALSPFTSDRQGLLTKCTPIDLEMAKKLLDHGYKQLSKFKRWCPVEVR